MGARMRSSERDARNQPEDRYDGTLHVERGGNCAERLGAPRGAERGGGNYWRNASTTGKNTSGASQNGMCPASGMTTCCAAGRTETSSREVSTGRGSSSP